MLSVIVLAHDQVALTRRCLDALVAATEPLDVILVDNGSRDAGVAGLGREYAGRFERFRYVRSRDNLSYARANNRAVSEAVGDVLLFLNNDVIVSPHAPERLGAVVRETGSVAGAKLVFPDRARIQHAGMQQMLWGYASNLGTCAPAGEPALSQPTEMFAVTGAMLAISRELFPTIGGFDERYRWGYEDVDLCLKARSAGRAVRYVPDACSVHAESATLGAVRRPADLGSNYALYRRRWNHRLVPAERKAVARLRLARIRRVAVFGTGLAAAGLCRRLTRDGIEVVGFTASTVVDRSRHLGRPVAPLHDLHRWQFDRLVIGTQHYYALRDRLAPFDPAGRPLFPAVDLVTG